MCGIVPQASLYIRMSDPPQGLPGSITLDRRSEWQTSALLATAMETMTLPSRLKHRNESCTTLSELADFLKSSGNQAIAKLSLGIGSCMRLDDNRQGNLEQEQGFQAEGTLDSFLASVDPLEIELFPGANGTAKPRKKTTSVFRRADVVRDDFIQRGISASGVIGAPEPLPRTDPRDMRM